MGFLSTAGYELSTLEQAAREASAAAKYISSYCDLKGVESPAFGPQGADAGLIRDAPVDVREARQRLLGASLKLQHLVTDPTEYLAWQGVQYQIIAAVRWLCHFEVLSAIPLHSTVNYDYLAGICNVPVRQLQSMARMAMTSNFLCEPQPGMVAHNPVSRCFATNHAFSGWIRFMTDYYMPCAAKSIEATEKWGETNDKCQTASNLAMDTPLSAFDFITQSKELGRLFSSYMKGVHSGIATNVSQIVQDFDWNSIGDGLVVHVSRSGGPDCGLACHQPLLTSPYQIDGSPGHVAVALATAHPRLRVVIQDSPETLANSRGVLNGQPALVRSRIETQLHNCFDPQPILDADVYILRMTLHNHPDDEAVRVLDALLLALKTNPAARLLIIDTVLSDRPGTEINPRDEGMDRYRDMVMLQVFSTKERSLDEFNKLLADASDQQGALVVKSVRKSPGATISTIEVAYETAAG